MEQDLFTVLDAVGSVYPVVLPQNPTLPAMTYQRISDALASHVSGASTLTQSRVQVDCWGRTYASAKALANQVITALDGYEGDFKSIVLTTRDFFEEGSEIYRVSVDVSIWHRG